MRGAGDIEQGAVDGDGALFGYGTPVVRDCLEGGRSVKAGVDDGAANARERKPALEAKESDLPIAAEGRIAHLLRMSTPHRLM